MKVRQILRSGTLHVEFEGSTQKEIFGQLALNQEVFEEAACGCCGNKNIKFVKRTVDDNDYYEMHCTHDGCRARLAFGQNKTGGTLYPKRKEEDGTWSKTAGWSKYDPSKAEEKPAKGKKK